MIFFRFLLIFSLSVTLFAQMDYNSTRYRQAELARMQMVREAKLLLREYRLLENKYKSWQARKAQLIARFEEKNRVVAQMHLGEDNRYGEKVALKRRSKFYNSIAAKDRKIQNRLEEIRNRLAQLKEEFKFRYGVALTEDEIFFGKKAHVKHKQQKIALLREYINYMESYENLRKINAKYDEAESLIQSIAKINDKERRFEENLTKKAELNRMKMYEYKTMAERLREELANKYDIEVVDLERAKAFLENLRYAY